MSHQKLLYTVGCPGSGKTTWALQFLEQHQNDDPRWQRISRDDLRMMCSNVEHNIENENFITVVEDKLVRSALEEGFSVIVDATHIEIRRRNRWHRLAQEIGNIEVIEKGFDVSLETCLERNNQRSRHVPNKIIKDMHSRLKRAGIHDLKSTFYHELDYTYVKDNTKPLAMIVDLDGTIADNSWRDKYRGDLYEQDPPIQDVIDVLLRTINHQQIDFEKCHVIFLTARDEEHRIETINWLKKNVLIDVNVDLQHTLLMRPHKDERPDFIVKHELFVKHIKEQYNVICSIEDRPRNCRMWRRFGITTFQLTDIEF